MIFWWRDDLALDDTPQRHYAPVTYALMDNKPRGTHCPEVTLCPGWHYAPRHYAPTTLCQGGWYAPGDTLSGWAALLVYISYGPIPSYEYLDSCTFWTCVHSKRPLRDALKIARDRLKMCQSCFGTLFFGTLCAGRFDPGPGVNIFHNSPRITREKFPIFGIWGKVWWNSIPSVLSRFGMGKC